MLDREMFACQKTRKRKQKGGMASKLYSSVDMITDEEIERIFCNGRTLEEMPVSETPFFILKWGPPGSGKSSAKVIEQIERLGIPIENYVDFTPDKIIESLIDFRYETTASKITDLRVKADIVLKNYAHAGKLLQTYAKNRTRGYNGKLQKEMDTILSQGSLKKNLSPEMQEKILYDKISGLYKYYRKSLKNREGRTIFDKMEVFLRKAMGMGVCIQYETMGSGYGEGESIHLKNQFTGERFTRLRATKEKGVIDIFKNNWESMLGKIIYTADGEPARLEKVGDMHIPDTYSIVVVYPILPLDSIRNRASMRAMRQLMDKEPREFIGDSPEYIEKLAENLQSIFYGGRGEAKNIMNDILEKEAATILKNTSFQDKAFQQYLASTREGSRVTFPVYRAIATDRIVEVAEQAFQYAVDYFLKQYILLGRIKSVIYVSNL